MPAPHSDAGQSTDRRPTDTPGSNTVLLVDDDDAFRETLALWLEDSQWETQTASGGKAALSKLTSDVDVLVLDRRMPDLSGPEVIDRLDDTDFTGPVIVLSAFEPDDHLCDDDDATAYLTKPVDGDTLIDTIDSVR